MELSVIVPTLNARASLERCLDAIAEHTPSGTEVVVVNGPSSDGTTGAVQDRSDVAVLLEIAERNRNVARNAGIAVAEGDVLAFLGDDVRIDDSWHEAIELAMAAGTDAISGPVGPPGAKSATTGDSLPPLCPRNVALSRPVIRALDGFDEYLHAGGIEDLAHRLAAQNADITWSAGMRGRLVDGGSDEATDWGEEYRSLTYCLAKNYGPRPHVLGTTGRHMIRDAAGSARGVLRGDGVPTAWFRDGRTVMATAASGLATGLRARYGDRTPRRNPNGLSSRSDRTVQSFDWR